MACRAWFSDLSHNDFTDIEQLFQQPPLTHQAPALRPGQPILFVPAPSELYISCFGLPDLYLDGQKLASD
jgi:hypothetical protein